jgi:hypothetical protein
VNKICIPYILLLKVFTSAEYLCFSVITSEIKFSCHLSWLLFFIWRSLTFPRGFIISLSVHRRHSQSYILRILLPISIYVNQLAVLVSISVTIDISRSKTGALSRCSRHIVLTICEAHTNGNLSDIVKSQRFASIKKDDYIKTQNLWLSWLLHHVV